MRKFNIPHQPYITVCKRGSWGEPTGAPKALTSKIWIFLGETWATFFFWTQEIAQDRTRPGWGNVNLCASLLFDSTPPFHPSFLLASSLTDETAACGMDSFWWTVTVTYFLALEKRKNGPTIPGRGRRYKKGEREANTKHA